MMTYLSDTVHYYQEMQITTASPAKLICIMHEQCERFLLQANQCAQQERRALLNRAQNVLVLLQRSLIIGDSISKSLFYLYDYCYSLLEHNDDRCIAATITILDPLRQTFNRLQSSNL